MVHHLTVMSATSDVTVPSELTGVVDGLVEAGIDAGGAYPEPLTEESALLADLDAVRVSR